MNYLTPNVPEMVDKFFTKFDDIFSEQSQKDNFRFYGTGLLNESLGYIRSINEMLNRQKCWEKIGHFFSVPVEFEKNSDEYKSVMKFYDGRPVKTAEGWQERRREILELWHNIMGEWNPVIEKPKIEYIENEHIENFTRHRVNIEIAPGRKQMAYLLIPDGKGIFPSVLDVFYEPEGGAGLDEKSRLQVDFGYQLAKRGFVALCLGSPG